MFKKLFMQWRQILFSFVILFGSALWALPSSASAFDICIPDTSPGCPTGSTLASPVSPCFIQPVGNTPEHRCSSTVNPCLASSGGSCASSCGADTFVDNNCATTTGCSQKWCVSKTIFNAAVAASPCVSTPTTTCTVTPPPDCTANPALFGCKTITVGNPLSFSTVEGVLGSLLGALQGIIVVLSLVFIVIGAVLYITSAGDDGRMKVAKGAITASMIGLALGLAAPSFLKQIGSILGWGPVAPTANCPTTLPAADLKTCQAAQAVLNAGKPLSEIAMNILQFLLSIVGVLGIIMLVVGGIIYITATGDEDRIDTGKKIVKYAIIGIAIALASLVAVTQIAALFA